MYISMQYIIPEIVKDAEKYFPKTYVKNLKRHQKYKENLVARYLISLKVKELYEIPKYIPEVNHDGIPLVSKHIHWSISYKTDICCIGISNKAVGVDIECYKKRDDSLLDHFSKIEYDMLSSKSWESFYILWTAKESLNKKLRGESKDVEIMEIHSINKEIITIDGVEFSYEIKIDLNEKKYLIYTGVAHGVYYSICYGDSVYE